MNYSIHKALPEDAEGIGAVHYSSWMNTYTGLMPAEFLELMSLNRSIRIASSCIDSTSVAEHDGKIVGFIIYANQAREDISIPGASEIIGINVLQEYQRQGVGKALIMEAAATLSAEQICLYVLKDNEKAIGFYKSLGFRFTGKFLRRRVPGGEYCELEMVLNRSNPTAEQS